LAAFGSTRRKDVAVADDDQVRLLLEAKRRSSPFLANVAVARQESLAHDAGRKSGHDRRHGAVLKENGKFVVYDAEHAFDGFKDNAEYALATWQAAEKAGADVIALCDTNGGTLPGEIAAITGPPAQIAGAAGHSHA
jgi:2-isopropylmalate synthase